MKTLWTLQIVTNWRDAGDGVLLCGCWQDAAQQNAVHPIGDLARPYTVGGAGANTPWGNQQSVRIVGYQVAHQVLSPGANFANNWQGTPAEVAAHMVVGSGHGGDGADVFAQTGGIGSTQQGQMWPPDIILPQGILGSPNAAHFDIYGSVYGANVKQRGIVLLYYTDAV